MQNFFKSCVHFKEIQHTEMLIHGKDNLEVTIH